MSRRALNIGLRVLAAAIFALVFVLDEANAWIAALGFVPLLAATILGCPWSAGTCPAAPADAKGDASGAPRTR